MKAIETVYRGYRFRSRLEARWAVFFDALGVEYEYEPEGFDLGKFGWYLPDFQILGSNVFVEIKPRGQWTYQPHLEHLANTSGHTVIYVCGNPWPGEYGICQYGPEGEISGSDPLVFAWERKDEKLWVAYEGDWGFYASVQRTSERAKVPMLDHPFLTTAYKMARTARFEHGESGG